MQRYVLNTFAVCDWEEDILNILAWTGDVDVEGRWGMGWGGGGASPYGNNTCGRRCIMWGRVITGVARRPAVHLRGGCAAGGWWVEPGEDGQGGGGVLDPEVGSN